jgi:hypothetical protein
MTLQLDEGLLRLHQGFTALGLPYFVGGSVAAMVFGEPRLTNDIDLVVKAEPADAPRIFAQFPHGPFYCPQVSVLVEELGKRRGGQFNVLDIQTAMKADVYVAGDDPLIAYGFEHAAPHAVGAHRLNVAPPTYVIAMKLRFWGISHQEKHLRDIRNLLGLAPSLIDHAEVERWAARDGVLDAWRRCQDEAGEE